MSYGRKKDHKDKNIPLADVVVVIVVVMFVYLKIKVDDVEKKIGT